LRDILTVIAGFVILILAAALIAPPFLDWEMHRDAIDRAVSRATGTEARTEGRIGVRLLPSPRIRFDRLRLGGTQPDAPSLTSDFIWSEIALTPLLRGEVRFLDTRVGRADIRIPVSENGSWRLPAELLAGDALTRQWAIDDLRVSQLLVTTHVPTTGRTDQLYAENVAIESQKLIGPWRIEGTTAGVPFRFATGELASDRTIQVKLTGGGEVFPRFDIDGKLALDPGADGTTTPNIAGKARVFLGPGAQTPAAAIPIPVAVETGFSTSGGTVELENVVVEAGEGGASLRLTGTGAVRTGEPRLSLKLEGRRADADNLLIGANPRDLLSSLSLYVSPATAMPVDLDLAIGSVAFAQEELANVGLKASFHRGRVEVERMEFTAPGETRIVLSGGLGWAAEGGVRGRITVASGGSDRFARYLDRLGWSGPALSLLDGTPFEAAADVVLDRPVSSFRNVRVKAGAMTLTGQGRYTAPEGAARGRLEAQVGVLGLNLSQLPQVSSLFDATQNLDVGFTLDARNVRAGARGGAGRISARIASDGPALVVETLDIVDLAGANARVAGRIAPDGSGRIAGKVTAQRAAPLVDLLGSVWIGGVSKLVPSFLREGELDLDIVTERATPEPGSSELKLRTTARGRAAGGGFEGDVLTADGLTQSLDVRVTTDNTGRWIDRPDAAVLRRPSRVTLHGTRVGSGSFNVMLAGDIGGVRIVTTRPFALGVADDVIESGEADLQTADLRPFMVLLDDGASLSAPVPVEARVALQREQDASLVVVDGKVAGDAVRARLAVRSPADVSGSITLDRLSLPWLVTTLALDAPADPQPNALWSRAKFEPGSKLLAGGKAVFRVKRIDMGRGLMAENAGFTLGVTEEGLSLREFDAMLGGGRVTGMLSVTRQGPSASIVAEGGLRDVPLATLAGPTTLAARISGDIKVGATAESASGLVANLGGAGEARLSQIQVPDAAPQALNRALQRLLADSDPLAARRTETILAEELARAPITSPVLAGPIAIVNGVLRLSPAIIDGGTAVWQGAITYDMKTLLLDARGTLMAKTAAPPWTGALPSVGLAWRGPLGSPVHEIDPAPLANGIAAIVLQRELEKIEAFEAEQSERQRRAQQQALQRQRERDRQIAEEAARQARLREEQERARGEIERVRVESERLQAEQRAEQRARAEAERRAAQELQLPTPSALPSLPPPIDIRPAPQIGVRPGG
jgi:hypothetical protein